PERDPRDMTGGRPQSAAHVSRYPFRPIVHFVRCNFQRTLQAIELPGEPQQGRVAVRAHAVDDGADPSLERAIAAAAAGEQTVECRAVGRGNNANHSTILFNGYSTIP